MDRGSQRAVLERLTALDDMAGLPTARSQIRRIIDGWRTLLAAHQPTGRGRCPMCSGWLRSRKWPCQVWITAHNQLIGDGLVEQQPAPAPRGSAHRPREVEVVPRTAGHRDDGHEPPAVPSMRDDTHPMPPCIHRAAVAERRPTPPHPRLSRHRHG